MAAALGPPEVIAQLENAAKVLMVSAPRRAPAPASRPCRARPGAAKGRRRRGARVPVPPPCPVRSRDCARPGRARRERGSRPRRPPGAPVPAPSGGRAGPGARRCGSVPRARPAREPPLRSSPRVPGLPPAATSGNRAAARGRASWGQGHRARLRPVRPAVRAFPSLRPGPWSCGPGRAGASRAPGPVSGSVPARAPAGACGDDFRVGRWVSGVDRLLDSLV